MVEPGEGAARAALFRFFERVPRQGPGDAALTRALYRATLSSAGVAPVRAADMGCGAGAAGLVLAEAGAEVLGVDVSQAYLDAFAAAAAARGLSDRVSTCCASMLDSGAAPGSLDLVWSEGAVFTVGFETALSAFFDLLRPGGHAVVSEAMWLVSAPSPPMRAFWEAEYPAIRDVSGALGAASGLGYRFVRAETLPAAAWETSFFAPIEAALGALGPEHGEERAVGEGELVLRDLMRAHPDEVSYVFLVLQRPNTAPGAPSV